MASNSEETEKRALMNDSAMDLMGSLLKNEDSLNYTSLMKMANKLLKDETLMELVGDIGLSTSESDEELDSYQGEDQELYRLQKQVENMHKELEKTKQELAILKKQDTSIISLGMKVIKAANQDLKKGLNILTGVEKRLK
ncbi:hypothetical protein [Cytobacillus praedii]|uniref:Uncharacterized protein n=1 Tax=Cytobacillus praedii TaxID=1742358 RepID=A0A4R1AXM5_9BACI|nr:hypothetical protein [Cytobacillus praedii]TCJ02372.1 hypothetical protein E0Y62_19755 [Cytobacillus praedii]